MLSYKGYVGEVEVDFDAKILHGRVLYIRDVITFQGTTVEEAEQAFRDSIDEYLDFCAELGDDPDKPFSGKLVLRIAPEIHKGAAIAAMAAKMSLNQWLSDTIRGALHRGEVIRQWSSKAQSGIVYVSTKKINWEDIVRVSHSPNASVGYSGSTEIELSDVTVTQSGDFETTQ